MIVRDHRQGTAGSGAIGERAEPCGRKKQSSTNRVAFGITVSGLSQAPDCMRSQSGDYMLIWPDSITLLVSQNAQIVWPRWPRTEMGWLFAGPCWRQAFSLADTQPNRMCSLSLCEKHAYSQSRAIRGLYSVPCHLRACINM